MSQLLANPWPIVKKFPGKMKQYRTDTAFGAPVVPLQRKVK